jgi:serine/threonine-protein kinase
MRRRFILEAQITAMLQHPSILPVYHFSEQGEEVFYTMRPVEGRSLAELIRSMARDPTEGCREWTVAHLIRIFLQVASAMAFAHSRGVIHGDLKPANIMIGRFEEVVILDWGVAAVAQATSHSKPKSASEVSRSPGESAEHSRVVSGTPRYLAPELLSGEQRSAQSDIFALGVILYELLALRPPWEGRTVAELVMVKDLPPSPISVQPFRNIPHRLVSVMNRALERNPSKRYPTVESFAHDVAETTEGRGTWVCERRTTQPWAWSRIGGEGRTTRLGDTTVLRSTGRRNSFQFVLEGPFSGNLRVSFEMNPARGRHHLGVVLSAAGKADSSPRQGYSLAVLAGNGATLSLLRNGRDVAGAANPQPEPGNWTRVVAQRIDNRISLLINELEVYSYVDPIPLTGSHLALAGRSSSGVSIRNFQVASGGANSTLSCLAVPDAFFNRQLFDIAVEEYLRIARSMTGTAEGRVAALRACLSAVEAARAEPDLDLRAVRLEEFRTVLRELAASDRACLFELAAAIVACERSQPIGERILLNSALTSFPEDPQRSVVQEWILTRLHGALQQDRLAVAQLAPLALQFSMDASGGRRLIRNLIRRVRRDWEMPSLLESRLHDQMDDLTARAEALLFFGFWSAQPLVINGAIRDLAGHALLEPRHVVDGLFALMELDAPDLAAEVLDWAKHRFGPEFKLAPSFLAACSASLCTLQRRLDLAENIFATLVPDEADRLYNGTRLRLAYAQFSSGSTAAALRTLRQVSPGDFFACEHRAWLYLLLGESDAAFAEVSPLIEQGNHKRPRDLCNFLYCAALLGQGKTCLAREIAALLPDTEYPRTWTLGSYHLSGRLGGGDVNQYLLRAHPWERRQLGRHLALLAKIQDDAEGVAFWSGVAKESLVQWDSNCSYFL